MNLSGPYQIVNRINSYWYVNNYAPVHSQTESFRFLKSIKCINWFNFQLSYFLPILNLLTAGNLILYIFFLLLFVCQNFHLILDGINSLIIVTWFPIKVIFGNKILNQISGRNKTPIVKKNNFQNFIKSFITKFLYKINTNIKYF